MKEEFGFSNKNITVSLENYEQIQPLAHALSSELRLRILCLIRSRGMSVNEIAQELDVPVSTAALNVQVLEKAGLIDCEIQPGVRGTQKLCTRKLDEVSFRLWWHESREGAVHTYDMPVGCYSRVSGIQPTCGLAVWAENIHMDDTPGAFYHPVHFQAGLLWMREGSVEYSFPKPEEPERLEYLEFSFEACSEAVGFRNDWPSDIYVCINDVEIGVWRCPGDMGGHRGSCNPDWWPQSNTQYGFLKNWRVDQYRTLLDKEGVSKVRLKDLNLDREDCVRLRIGTRKIGEHAGGMNLFGRDFGDYPQDIRMEYCYSGSFANKTEKVF